MTQAPGIQQDEAEAHGVTDERQSDLADVLWCTVALVVVPIAGWLVNAMVS